MDLAQLLCFKEAIGQVIKTLLKEGLPSRALWQQSWKISRGTNSMIFTRVELKIWGRYNGMILIFFSSPREKCHFYFLSFAQTLNHFFSCLGVFSKIFQFLYFFVRIVLAPIFSIESTPKRFFGFFCQLIFQCLYWFWFLGSLMSFIEKLRMFERKSLV